mgnify:CR=1 FL=1
MNMRPSKREKISLNIQKGQFNFPLSVLKALNTESSNGHEAMKIYVHMNEL